MNGSMRSPLRSIIRVAMALFVATVVFGVLAADSVAPFDPLEQDVGRRLVPPGGEHFFGTDGFGRDVFSRTLYGGRTTIAVATAAVAAAGVAGVSLGLISAYAGGRFDLVIQRGVDLLLGFPFLVLALVVVVALTPSAMAVAAAISVSLTPSVVRVGRAAALQVAGEEYLLVIRSTGAGAARIIFRHILKAAWRPVTAYLTTCIGTAVAAEATLSYLGLGIPPPYPSWGRMLLEGSRVYFDAAPWVTLLPGTVLCLTIVGLVLLGNGPGYRSPPPTETSGGRDR